MAPTGPAKKGYLKVRPKMRSAVSGSKFSWIVSMFSRTSRQASKLRIATVPLPLAPGPGIVAPQARPLHTGQAWQGPICPRAACKTSG